MRSRLLLTFVLCLATPVFAQDAANPAPASNVASGNTVEEEVRVTAPEVNASNDTEPALIEPEAVTPEPAAQTTTPEVPLAEPSPPPAPGPLFQTVVANTPIRITGSLHTMIVGTQGVQSFGFATASAPTSALNPYASEANDFRLSFQAQQTRLGLIVGNETAFRGQVEIDFIHFDQSSPTTQAFPRLRIANLEYNFGNHRVFLGQTWDLFGNGPSPLLSHSINLVGTLFQSGNIGFMRHQLGWSSRIGAVEVAAAVGLPGSNAGPTFGNLELGAIPTLSFRTLWHLNDKSTIGASAIVGSPRFSQGTEHEQRLAAGGQLFGDIVLGSFALKAEAYVAENLANLGSLNLAFGRFGQDIVDVGGFASAKWTHDIHAVTLMLGGAVVLKPSLVQPGYTADMRVLSPGTLGPGLRSNWTIHAAYWLSPTPGLSMVIEPYVFGSNFAGYEAEGSSQSTTFGVMVGSLFQF